jgi:hypothetical protein
MKRILFICFFSVFYSHFGKSEGQLIDCSAQTRKQLISDYLTSVDKLINAVRICESGMNDFAVGKAKDTGPLQITPIRLLDYNRLTKSHYTLNDCYKFEVSKKIFLFYAGRVGFFPTNFEEICRRWNRDTAWKDEKGQQYWNLISKQLNKATCVK